MKYKHRLRIAFTNYKKGIIMKKYFLVSIASLIMCLNVFAQESDTLLTSKVQVTFAYPLGSNGLNSLKYSNNFSLNILFGLNGGVNGAEIGGLMNYNKGEVKWFQLAGITNINEKQSRGLILSGVSNIVMDSSSGALISGVFNYSKYEAKGFQLSTINIAATEFSGFQLGVFNYANKLDGVQLGVVNIVGNVESGVPIGLITIVKNDGHYEFEATAGEVLYANLNYKMGIEQFYTIFKAGYSSYKSKPVYSYGFGFGGNVSLAEKHKISIDLSANNIVYDNNWSGELNLLNKADFNYKYSISEKLSLMAGPSFNVYVTQEKIDGEYGTLNIPYTIYTKEKAESKLYMWIGFNAGLAVKL
jgi:hypothetical protein